MVFQSTIKFCSYFCRLSIKCHGWATFSLFFFLLITVFTCCNLYVFVPICVTFKGAHVIVSASLI